MSRVIVIIGALIIAYILADGYAMHQRIRTLDLLFR